MTGEGQGECHLRFPWEVQSIQAADGLHREQVAVAELALQLHPQGGLPGSRAAHRAPLHAPPVLGGFRVDVIIGQLQFLQSHPLSEP